MKKRRVAVHGKWRGEVELRRLPRLKLLDAMNGRTRGSGPEKVDGQDSVRVPLELASTDEGEVRGQLGDSPLRGEYREDALRLTVQGDPSGFLVLSPQPNHTSPLQLVGRLRLASLDTKRIYAAEVTLTRAQDAGIVP